jgi:two-component system, NarL family, sensor histidine kinase DesK
MSIDWEGECDRPDGSSAGRDAGPFLTRFVPFRHAPRAVRSTSAVIWLAFIVFPLIDAFGKHGSVLQRGLIIAGAIAFVAAYVAMVVTWKLEPPTRLSLFLFLVLLCIASALTVGQSSNWGFLFTYAAACSALVARKQLGLYAVALCTALAAATSAIAGANGGTVIGFVAACAGVGMLMFVMSDLRLRNQELSEARAELARMAVSRERERFARDLHDLLGHSLSVITLKAELAGRMLADRPDDAAREIAELEQVARGALGEVREAVSGYRQPTLEGELAGARMALSAAGIEADVHEARVPLDPEVEAVLAWAVREGATNVIRHSGARHCSLRVTASLTDSGVEVIDDGAIDDGDATAGARPGARSVNGTSRADASGGHGLAGLAERARLVGGTLEAGRLDPGGYRLAVTVPVSRA